MRCVCILVRPIRLPFTPVLQIETFQALLRHKEDEKAQLLDSFRNISSERESLESAVSNVAAETQAAAAQLGYCYLLLLACLLLLCFQALIFVAVPPVCGGRGPKT